MPAGTPIWIIEGIALDSTGELVANSLAARILLIQAGVIDPADLAAIKAVTDVIPDAGAMTSISDVTDALPDAGALTGISDETDKIDDAAVDGLAGTEHSIGYMLGEIERHFHNRERWWGSNGGATETNAIAATVTVPFVAVSGNDTWGTAIPICGTADAPVPSPDNDKFDCHRIMVTDLDDDTTPWRLRIIYGTGTSGDAITAGQWTEIMVMTNAVPGNRAGASPVDIIMRRVDVGSKLWAQSWNDTNAEELSFFWGAHGYEG